MRARDGGSSAIEIAERAVHLLLATPPRVHLLLLLASAPFALGLLVFVLELGLGARNEAALAGGATALTLLYLALKLGQAAHAHALMHLAAGVSPLPGWRELLSGAGVQLRWQPWSLWLLPFAALATVPYGWTQAFFSGLTVVGDPGKAWRLALLWPRQNHALILLFLLCGGVIFLNVWIAVLLAPFLVRTFAGIETDATLSPWAMFNLTTFAVALMLSQLALAPLSRAAAVLRAFEGESRASGADLLATLRRLRAEHRS